MTNQQSKSSFHYRPFTKVANTPEQQSNTTFYERHRWLFHRRGAMAFQAITYMLAGFGIPVDITFFALPYLTSQMFGPVATFYAALIAGSVLSILFLGLSLYSSYKANDKELSLIDKRKELNDNLKKTQRCYTVTSPRKKSRLIKRDTLTSRDWTEILNEVKQSRRLTQTTYNFSDQQEDYQVSVPDISKSLINPTETKPWLYSLVNWCRHFLGGAVFGVGLGWGIYGIRLISPYTQTGLMVIGSIALLYGLVTAITEAVLIPHQNEKIEILSDDIKQLEIETELHQSVNIRLGKEDHQLSRNSQLRHEQQYDGEYDQNILSLPTNLNALPSHQPQLQRQTRRTIKFEETPEATLQKTP